MAKLFNGLGGYPWIVEEALKLHRSNSLSTAKPFVLGVDNNLDFDAFHSRKYNDEVQLYAFDMLAGG